MITKYLISLSATGKIRVVYLSTSEEWNDELHGYTIERRHGQLLGKMQDAPTIVITKGKAGRTHKEQLELQFKSEWKKYLDKGYREIDKDPELCSEEELLAILGDVKKDQNGFSKHMLAKSSDKVSQATIDKVPYWYASRKIDGVRAALYWKDGEIHTASRGGGDYDCSMMQFIENKELQDFFKVHPDYVFDGEIYSFGKTLQCLSGEARRCETMNGSDYLEFYLYDIMIPDVPFEERLKLINVVKESLHLGFDPQRKWNPGELRIQIVPQVKVSGYENIMKLHNDYVEEGWEGVVCRNPSKPYGFGKRSNDMLKFKKYKDSCFTVVGIEQGLRPFEDMVFVLVTKEGAEFKAKPMGDLAQKIEYTKNFESKYLGKIGECKFFYYSEDGIPLQPSFKAFRDDLTYEDL